MIQYGRIIHAGSDPRWVWDRHYAQHGLAMLNTMLNTRVGINYITCQVVHDFHEKWEVRLHAYARICSAATQSAT